ncbi:MAG: DUF3261 domain-containing protein [Gammaproteobacteria bacterium]
MAWALTACVAEYQAGAERPASEQTAAASPRPLFPIARPLGPSRRIVQQLTAHWPGRTQNLLCVLELDSRHIAMAGLTNDGLSLFNLSYDGKTVKTDNNPLLPERVAPELIIADLQLVYWPLDVLQDKLPKHLRLETGPDFRRITERGQPRIEVRYLTQDKDWPRRVELTHLHYHYRLSIRTVSYEVVSE